MFRPGRRTFLQATAHALATFFGIGYAPSAPGTFGSIPGVVMGLILARTATVRPVYGLALWTGLLAIGLWSVIVFEASEKVHDDSRVVIDEVMGQSLAFLPLVFLAPSVLYWEPLELTLLCLAAFTLFRIFDIWKPGPLGWIDRTWETPLGTCLDDLLAGLIAGIILIAGLFFL
jgi:phosphatidylglycerophosphatase A